MPGSRLRKRSCRPGGLRYAVGRGIPHTFRLRAIVPVRSRLMCQGRPRRSRRGGVPGVFFKSRYSRSGRNGRSCRFRAASPEDRGANSPRMEIVAVMRRKIAVGMLGLALAGCAQSRSSVPGAASRGQPIGMEPVPSINDTINRGTGDPAIARATLPDPKDPKWTGEFVPPRGPAGTPPGPQVARSGLVQGSASSTASASRASAPASAVLASPSSPPPASAAGLLAGAGMPAPAADPQAARAPTAPPLQTVPSQQPGMTDLEVSRSPGEVPPTAAAAGSPAPDQALPPVEEPRAVGARAPRSKPPWLQARWLRHPRLRPPWLQARWLRPPWLRPPPRIRGPRRRLSLLELPRLPVVRLRWRISFWGPIPT